MRIVVLDGYTLNPGDNPWDDLAGLGELIVHDRTPPADVARRAADAEILLTNKTRLAAEVLRALPHLRFIAVLATGFDIVDIAAARGQRIVVSNVPEYGTDSVAQHVFALLLALAHHVEQYDAAVHAGEWGRAADFSFWHQPPLELAGLTLGIVGFGRIGRRVAELAQSFRMQVIASASRGVPSHLPDAVRGADLETVVCSADVVSLHCPLTATTAGMVNAELLRRMKTGSYLINTARGGLLDEVAVRNALIAGTLAGCAVDVASVEPIRPDNPLLHAPRCLITPHLAWASLAARRRLMRATVENVRAFIAGQPIHVVS